MYIIKNAFRSISRSKGRNILIGIIALVIAVSSCIGLSIRQASENAKADTLEGMNIFRNLADQGKCVILVSHSPDVAAMCDKRYELLKVSTSKKSAK